MNIPRQQTGYKQSQYERPNQKWVCGWAAEGWPCRIGPDSKGGCSAPTHAECEPHKEGDRWFCTRPEAFHGPCQQGPMPDGTCCKPNPEHPVCQPRLSIRAQRGRLVLGCVSLAIGVLGVLLVGPWRLDFISPGPLTATHAGIKPSAGGSSNCTVCHTAIDSRMRRATSSPGMPHQGLQESAKCLNCHFTQSKDTALLVHSVDKRTLDEQTTNKAGGETAGAPTFKLFLASLIGPPPQTSHGQMACATCHKEHQGRRHPLAFMDNTRCQACHQQKFASFSNGHPTFASNRARQSITFNHVSHQKTHFGNETFACYRCHVPDSLGRSMLLKPFAQSCAGCHHAGSDDHHSGQINRIGPTFVLQLPGIEFGDEDLYWPSPDELDVDLELAPLMRLLLAGDEKAMPALRQLEEDDLLADELGTDAKVALAWAIKHLLHDLAGGDPPRGRLAKALLAKPSDPYVRALAGELTLARSAAVALKNHWLPKLEDDLTGKKVAPTEERHETKDPPENAPGWQYDPGEVGIVYQITGHADPFVKAWMDALVPGEVPPLPDDGEDAKFQRKLRAELREEIIQSFSSCKKCHAIDSRSGPRDVIPWVPVARGSGIHTYNKPFEHRQHLKVFASQDTICSNCHKLSTDTTRNRSGLLPQRQADCASCHRPRRAQDDCLTCHNYHGRRP